MHAMTETHPAQASHGRAPRFAGRVRRRRERRGAATPPAASLGSVLTLDAELYGLAQGLAGLRLQLGEALELLVQHNGLFELGYPDLSSYALQRCSRSRRWAEDTRAVARRLSSLPALREALLAGRVGWSMAELVSRHASPHTDAGLSEQAKQLTVRQMRAHLSESSRGKGEGEPEPGGAEQAQPAEVCAPTASSPEPQPLFVPGGDGEPTTVKLEAAASLAELDEADPVRTLTLTLDREVVWLLEATRILVEHLGGRGDTESWLEAVLAEALTSLPGRFRGELGDTPEAALDSAWLEQRARWRDQSEKRCEHNFGELLGLGRRPPVAAQPTEPLGDPAELESIAELDSWIAGAAERLASADLRMATLAERMHELEGWRRLGFASEAQYARERLGMSASSLRAKRALARQLGPLPGVRRALEQGTIGFDAATQLARVATEQTEEQWVERARRRTAKHLREEVELAELAARRTGQRASLPPTEEQMRALLRAAASGDQRARVGGGRRGAAAAGWGRDGAGAGPRRGARPGGHRAVPHVGASAGSDRGASGAVRRLARVSATGGSHSPRAPGPGARGLRAGTHL
jgi:hypothetical protein